MGGLAQFLPLCLTTDREFPCSHEYKGQKSFHICGIICDNLETGLRMSEEAM